MTVLAAASWDGEAAIAADSAISWGEVRTTTVAPKLRRFEWGIAGFTGSCRAWELLEEALEQWESGVDRLAHRRALVKHVRRRLEQAGWSASGTNDLPACEGLGGLIVTKGRKLLVLSSDLSLTQVPRYAAAGSGGAFALGALHVARVNGWAPIDAAIAAARAACEHDSGCRKPIKWKQGLP